MVAASIADLRARVGETIGTSGWIVVDQAMIDTFADATHDHQFIHVDPEKAKASPFGGTIAHGFLSLSLLPVMLAGADVPRVEGIRFTVNYGLDRVRFLSPVRSGARIRTRFRLIGFEEKAAGRFQQTMEATVEIEGGDRPALVAEWITQFLI